MKKMCMCEGAAKIPMQLPDNGALICNTCDGVIHEKLTSLIKDERKNKCGCVATTYADDRVEIKPCEIHVPLVTMQTELDTAQANLREAMTHIGSLTGALNQATAVLNGYSNVIVAYKRLWEGCTVHEQYTATYPPMKGAHGACTCSEVWRARMLLDRQRKEFQKAVDAGGSYHPVSPEPETLEEDAAEGEITGKQDILDGKLSPFVTAHQT